MSPPGDERARLRARRPLTPFQEHRRRRRLNSASACRDRREIEEPPRRLDPDQRLAQIAHARRYGFHPWEVAELVPGPVTAQERDAAVGANA